MNPFAQLIAKRAAQDPWAHKRPTPAPKPASKTQIMRDYLSTHGKATASDLAMEADVPNSGLVGALLKTDILRRRIFRRDGRYYWNPEYDERHDAEVRKAIAMLQRRGYKVIAP